MKNFKEFNKINEIVSSPLEEKIEEVTVKSTYDEALVKIFNWVKNGDITLEEFKTLVQANRDSMN